MRQFTVNHGDYKKLNREISMRFFVILFFFICTLNVQASYMRGNNSPFRFAKRLEMTFLKLPLEGKIKNSRLAWPGSHWADHLGGIAHRWSSGEPLNFTYVSPQLNDLRSMPEYKIDELSPAEKFDIYRGDYRYSTVRSVYKKASPRENKWHGICHGTAPASLNHNEPIAKTMTNRNGVKVHFYASDIKALLSYYYAYHAGTRATLIGARCNVRSSRYRGARRERCLDVNAASFHLIITNFLGLMNKPFIADTDRYSEVWNHVASKFSSYIVDQAQSPVRGATIRYRVQSEVSYASAIAPKFGPVLGTEDAVYHDENYDYYLDVDQNGKIIAGEWISETRPDFLWLQGRGAFRGKWSFLKNLL